jgi:hypothetical protein
MTLRHFPESKLAAALLIALSCGGFYGCDGRSTVDGTVVRSDDSPIEGAKVTLMEVESSSSMTQPSTSTSDSGGKFDVGLTHAPMAVKLKLTIEKEGFVTHAETFESPGRSKPRKFVLTTIEP